MAILEILAPIWPFVLGGLGILFGLFSHLRAKATAAQAQTKVAQAEKREAQAGEAVSKANEQATQAGADAAKERIDVENKIAAGDPGDSRRVLNEQWSRD